MSKPHLRLVVCDCPDCAPRELNMRKAFRVVALIAVPIYALLWAAWTVLP